MITPTKAILTGLLIVALILGYVWLSNPRSVAPAFSFDHDRDDPSVAASHTQIRSSRVTNSSALLQKFNANTDNPRVLNVHMIPHTHDDVGWLKTVEQYFEANCNDTIDTRGNVRGILTTTMEALMENDARTFVYVEIKYFKMWWDEQSDSIKDSVRYLIANRQLSFVNGGYCMHDEATTHFVGMVDQTTRGHDFLRRELGVVPTVGWQLDPFGHSATQASLLTARAGLDALYFGRIDYQDLQLRQLTQECEGLWNASPNHKNSTHHDDGNDFDTTVFWGLTGSYQGNYGPPNGFWFDILTPDNEPLVGMEETKRRARIQTFLRDLRVQADQTKGNHIMVTLGSDFHYREAHYNFQNYDLLISMIMAYQQWGVVDIPAIFGPQYDEINVFYSSPEYYTAMKHQESTTAAAAAAEGPSADKERIQWSIKTDDFFPYSDGPHSFWTGYFTSRTAFKRFERVASAFHLAARQIEAKILPSTTETSFNLGVGSLSTLEDALAVAQHHDAVSGTAKQHVANDYSKRLQTGLDKAASFAAQKLRHIMLEHPESDLPDLTYCQLLNETVCSISEEVTAVNDRALIVIVYNPLASENLFAVRLPVASDSEYRVERLDGYPGPSANVQVVSSALDTRTPLHGQAKYVLYFDTDVIPPVGALAFRISKSSQGRQGAFNDADYNSKATARLLHTDDNGVHVSNLHVTATFNQSTGLLEHIKQKGGELDVQQIWGYYSSFDSAFDSPAAHSDTSSQNSGAYIFRPSEPEQQLIPLHPREGGARFIDTATGTEVHVEFEEPWMHQVTRVFKAQPYIEIEYTIGPVPIEDGRGKEIVTRWNTPIKSDGVSYTDSNGREFMKRQKNARSSWNLETYEPVAGNYYPVNAAMYIEDKNTAFTLLTDRSQGGASLQSGSLELMVQRRTLVDDDRGVDEPMNETDGGMTAYPPYGDATRIGDGVIIRGTHRIMVGKGPVGARMARSVMDSAFAEPLVFVGSSAIDKPVTFSQPTFTSLRAPLTVRAMLITFAKLPNDERNRTSFLLRLGHQFARGEDTVLSQAFKVDLTTLFVDYDIVDVVEKTLSGNQDWDDYLDRRLSWTSKSIPRHERVRAPLDPTAILFHPMDIRTFQVAVKIREAVILSTR